MTSVWIYFHDGTVKLQNWNNLNCKVWFVQTRKTLVTNLVQSICFKTFRIFMGLLWEKHNWTLLHMFRKMLICHVSLAGACVSLTLNIFDLHQICHTACPWNISQMRNNEIMPPEKIYDHWSLCFTNLWSVDYRGKFAKWWRCKFLTNLFDICKQQIRNSDLWQRIWIQNN